MDGVAAAGPLSRGPRCSCSPTPRTSNSSPGAIRNGAAGYLVHGRFEPEELEARIKAVAAGEMVLSPAVTPAVFEALRRAPGTENDEEELGMGSLTAREREVLNLLARGMSNAAIAEELFITNKTVKNHVADLREDRRPFAGRSHRLGRRARPQRSRGPKRNWASDPLEVESRARRDPWPNVD